MRRHPHFFYKSNFTPVFFYVPFHSKLTHNLQLISVACREKCRLVALSFTHFVHFFHISDSYTPFFPVEQKMHTFLIYRPEKIVYTLIKLTQCKEVKEKKWVSIVFMTRMCFVLELLKAS